MDISRRHFLKTAGMTAAALAAAGESRLFSQAADNSNPSGTDELMWGALLHLSFNMWADVPVDSWGQLQGDQLSWVTAADHLRFDDLLWRELTQKMSDIGMNYVLVDVGDGVQFESHPEVSVKGAWSAEKVQKELDRCRKLGLEPIPKLNFSATHDTWLGPYARMVSTPKYYEVCVDLVKETLELFGSPRFLHLGYDEETYDHQAKYGYVVVRQGETWWKDFLFFVEQVEKNGSRPWIWSDYYWHHPEEFMDRMPRSVLQSNWYYSENFDPASVSVVQAYLDLDKAGFDQIPTGSNWASDINFQKTVEFCAENLSSNRLKGFLQTPWKPTLAPAREHHMRALDQVGTAKKWLEK